MKMFDRVFLDMDDVLNRFTMPALAHVGCPVSRYNFDKFPVECGYDIIRAANSFSGSEGDQFYDQERDQFFNRHEFWTLFGEDFWVNLPVSSEMIHFIDWTVTAVGLKNVYILTSATGAAGCLEGKRKWVMKNLGSNWLGRLITCKDKFVCANKHSILIDDSQANVDKFRDHGGHAIMVPRPWNPLRGNNAEKHVRCELLRMLRIDS